MELREESADGAPLAVGMTDRGAARFFRRAVWLPLLLPLPHALWYYFTEVRSGQSEWTEAFGLTVVHGLLYAGFALILVRRERGADERRALRVLWLAPACYAPILAVVLLASSMLMQVARGVRLEVGPTVGALGVFLVGGLMVGYASAALIYLLYLTRRGRNRERGLGGFRG